MSLLISDAMAAGTAVAQPPSGLSMMAMPAIMLVIFYFLLWRPQSKRAKVQREMVNALQKGDEVVTSGGVLGKVASVSEKFLGVLVSEGVEIKIQRAAVSTVLPKGTLKTI